MSDYTIDVDDSGWPLVIIVVSGNPSAEGAQRLSDTVDTLFARREKFAMVIDAIRITEMPNAEVRKVLADYQTHNEDKFRRYCVADATVIRSPLLRNMMTAINWISTPKHPTRIFDTQRDAIEWAREQLAAVR